MNEVKKKRNAMNFIHAIIILILIAGIVYLLVEKNNSTSRKYITEEDAKIVEKVKTLMVLPERVPSVTTIENADELKKQDFFKNVKNDDKILIYLDDTKVVIYRPSENKIVNVGPIVNDDSSKTDTTTNTESTETKN